MNENKEGFELDLQKLLLFYVRKWWLLLLCALAAGVLAFYVTQNFITPLYKASVTVYVNNVGSDQKINYITGTNLDTAQKLVSTYVNIIKSDSVLEKVIQEAGLEYSAQELRSVMSAVQVGETELFKVSITHPEPKMAARLANAIAEVAPGEIENVVEGSSTKIIDYAKVPEIPSSPNVTRNTVLGVMLGLIFALLYLTLRFLMDVRIKDEEELNAMFIYPVLGQIPSFVTDGTKKRSGYEKNVYASFDAGQREETTK